MNDLPAPQNEPTSPEQEPTGQTTPQPQPAAPAQPRCAFQSLCGAVNNGASRAKDAAERTAPKVKEAAKTALYWTAFGLSYASVFSWTLAANLTPESSKSGFRKGVSAGKDAADKWVEKMTRTAEQNATESPNDSGTAGGAIQPSPA